MDALAARIERDRAVEAFDRIMQSHKAARLALGVMATLPSAESLAAAQAWMLMGRPEDTSFASLTLLAQQRVETSQVEMQRDFETLRQVSLISLCGAAEYLVKAVFVDLAAADPALAAARLQKAKIKLSAEEVLGLSAVEQWFLIADRLFESLASSDPLIYPRVKKLLSEHAYLTLGPVESEWIQSPLTEEDERRLNEAYLVRNCLVHNGGKVSSTLARYARRERGSVLALDGSYGAELMLAVVRSAQSIASEVH